MAKLVARVFSLKEAISTAEGALHDLQAGEEQARKSVRTASAVLQKAERCGKCPGPSTPIMLILISCTYQHASSGWCEVCRSNA